MIGNFNYKKQKDSTEYISFINLLNRDPQTSIERRSIICFQNVFRFEFLPLPTLKTFKLIDVNLFQ